MLCYILQICSLFAACLPWCISPFHIFKPVTMFLWSINDSVDCLHYSKYKVESKHIFLDTTLCFFFKLSNLRPWSHEFFMKVVGGYKSLTIFAKKETSYICTLKTCIYIYRFASEIVINYVIEWRIGWCFICLIGWCFTSHGQWMGLKAQVKNTCDTETIAELSYNSGLNYNGNKNISCTQRFLYFIPKLGETMLASWSLTLLDH